MRKWIVALAAFFMGAAGCDGTPDNSEIASPALWQIESAQGEIKGWLFGTIHALPDGLEWQTSAFENAFDSAEILAVEIADFDNPDIFRQLATTRGLGPLPDRVSADRRDTLRKMMRKGGIRVGQFSNTEDWAAAFALSQISRDADPANGADQVLLRAARNPFNDQKNKEVIELEGVFAQLSIFDRLPASDQRDMLHSAIDEFDTPENEAQDLRRLWLAGDEQRLQEAVGQSFSEAPGLYKALMTDRNVAMAEKVIKLLATDERPFVAVGAAHMLGSDGLPALIRSRGYKVRRIQ